MEKMIIELEATLTKKLEAKIIKECKMDMLKLTLFMVSLALLCFIIMTI